jgi:alanine racemase
VVQPKASVLYMVRSDRVAEAVELRQAGITKPILILGHVHPATFPAAVLYDVRVPIFCYADAQALSQEAQAQGKTACFHFAVDTGMSRIGCQVTEEAADMCARCATLPNLKAEGLFSHFATADETDLTKTRAQAECFARFDQMLKERGVDVPLRHLDNSAGIMNFGCHYQMVRAGIVLYGLYPSQEVDPALLKLRPAMSWYSRISHIKTLEPGREISYGGTFRVEAPTRVATVPAGYADGYRRSLSNRFYVLIRGKKAPILGRVCMDQMLVDVTQIPEATVGDQVVLLGRSGDQVITAETIAAAAGSFNYEQVCDLSHRVSRVYYLNGEKVGTVNYLLHK